METQERRADEYTIHQLAARPVYLKFRFEIKGIELAEEASIV
jgi:hypothetical protein